MTIPFGSGSQFIVPQKLGHFLKEGCLKCTPPFHFAAFPCFSPPPPPPGPPDISEARENNVVNPLNEVQGLLCKWASVITLSDKMLVVFSLAKNEKCQVKENSEIAGFDVHTTH